MPKFDAGWIARDVGFKKKKIILILQYIIIQYYNSIS